MLAFEAPPKETIFRRMYFKLDVSDEETLQQDDEVALENTFILVRRIPERENGFQKTVTAICSCYTP